MAGVRVPRRSRGFSLIELTVVLLIVVILLTLGASVVGLASENSAISQTRKKQDAIREALATYLGKYKRLPCPDVDAPPDGSGEDDRTTSGNPLTPCTADAGALPYADLGLARDFALDGWDNLFTYRVTIDQGDPTLDWTRSSAFSVGKPGKLDVSTRAPDGTAQSITGATGTEKAVVVLVSHGKNGLGALTSQGTPNIAATTPDEIENSNRTLNHALFYQRDISAATAGPLTAFDDIVVFFKATDLVAPLIRDGTLRSAEGETNYQIGMIADNVYGRFIASAGPNIPTAAPGNTPPAGTAVPDGWGTAIRYYSCGSLITQTLPLNSDLGFRIISAGPNRVFDTDMTAFACSPANPPTPTGDDIFFDISVATMRSVAMKVNKTLPP